MLGRIISSTRSSTNHSRWYTGISPYLETPLKQPVPDFLHTPTTTLCLVLHQPVFLSVSVSLFLCSPSLSLSHTHRPTWIQDWEFRQSRRWKLLRAVSMPAELCEWGSDEREAHLVNWQFPIGFFIFTMKGLNPSQVCYSHQACRNGHIPANINNDSVSI